MEKEKRYYWLKLKDDFYDRDEIKIIEDMDNGADYINFYLKLLLKSVKTEGKLYFRDTIPYSPKMLASITGTNIDTVKVGVDLFLSLGLMEKWDDGTLFMVETQNMIGSETKWAQIKREQREKSKQNSEIGHCPKLSKKCPIETDTETEKETELEIDTETEIENDPLFQKWLDEYSVNAKNPPAYKASMRNRIRAGNRDAKAAFLTWRSEYLDQKEKEEAKQKIEEFDYTQLVGHSLGNKQINRVVDIGSHLHLFFDDGTDDYGYAKKDLYLWIHQKSQQKQKSA